MIAARTLALVIACLIPGGTLWAQPQPAAQGEARKETARPITAPFELLKSRHMAVMVKINGKGPYRLIFDTGAPTNIITNKLAKETGVLGKSDKTSGGLFGMPTAKSIDTLELGDVKLEKVQVMVMDHPTVAAISNALGPIDGLIGFPFFARFKTTIDYQKRTLTLEPNGYEPGDALKPLMDKMLNASRGKPEPAVVGSAALWGFSVEKKADDDEPGVTIHEVLEGGPAAASGLKAGDRLLTLDGRWTDSVADAFTAASLIRPGRAVEVKIQRGGKEMTLPVTPAKGL
jgi:hypothetical protein